LNSAERRDGGLAVMLVGLALAGPDDGRLVTAQRLAPCLRRADALLRNADAALFRARHGPEPICFYR
jgi:hypothetical protein